MQKARPARGCISYGGNLLRLHKSTAPPKTLGREEELLWDLMDNLEPEDGLIWVHDARGRDASLHRARYRKTLRELTREFNDKEAD